MSNEDLFTHGTSAGGSGQSRALVRRGRARILLDQSEERVVLHGMLNPAVADKIFREVLAEWGFQGSTTELRDVVTTRMAETSLQGTSIAADLEAVKLLIEGEEYPLLTLAVATSKYTSQPNPIRVFYRSFDNAIVPVKQYLILSEPANTRQRTAASLAYGVPMDKVAVCFDMFTDAAPHLDLTMPMLIFAGAIGKAHLSNRQAAVQSRGVNLPLHDTSNRHADEISGGGFADKGVMPSRGITFPALR